MLDLFFQLVPQTYCAGVIVVQVCLDDSDLDKSDFQKLEEQVSERICI